MKHKKIDDSEFEELILREITPITDMQLLILKGHILVEYAMNKFIDDCTDKSFDVYKENFQFSHKIKLSKALGLFSGSRFPYLENAILIFNKIRNSIAHYLKHDEAELGRLILIYKKPLIDLTLINEDSSDLEIFKQIIPTICGTIVGIKQGKQKIADFTKRYFGDKMKASPEEFEKRFRDFKN